MFKTITQKVSEMQETVRDFAESIPKDGRQVTQYLGQLSNLAIAESQLSSEAMAAAVRVSKGESTSKDFETLQAFSADTVGKALLTGVAMIPGGIFALPQVTRMAAKYDFAPRAAVEVFGA